MSHTGSKTTDECCGYKCLWFLWKEVTFQTCGTNIHTRPDMRDQNIVKIFTSLFMIKDFKQTAIPHSEHGVNTLVFTVAAVLIDKMKMSCLSSKGT